MPATNASKLYPAAKLSTFTLAQLVDADGLVLSVASNVAIQTYSGASLDGTFANPGPASFRMPRGISVTTSASGATYNTTDAIVITGTDENGDALVENITLANAGGSELQVTAAGFLTLTSIVTPAQLGGGGAFTFGVRDVVLSNARPARQVRHGAAGDILLGFAGDDLSALTAGQYRDIVTGIEAERHDAFILRVYGAATTTSDPVTIYI